jgi:hypothetical protein
MKQNADCYWSLRVAWAHFLCLPKKDCGRMLAERNGTQYNAALLGAGQEHVYVGWRLGRIRQGGYG